VPLLDGLETVAHARAAVETTDWRDDAAVAELATRSSVVVLALGLGPKLEGESLDRVGNELELPADQRHLIDTALEAGSPVVVVLFAGSAIAMDPWVDRVAAVLQAWYPGELGGRAVAEILLGDASPSGKLPITFPRSASQLPAFGVFPQRVTDYREGVFVGYRHFDADRLEPLFPFGHGLAYTRFEYSDLRVAARGAGEHVEIDVRFVVRNTGERRGTEVAQLYVGDTTATVPRPPRELKGFARVTLARGESRPVALRLHWRDLAFFDEAAHAWTVEPGEFVIAVGASSRDLRLEQRIEYADDAGP
jgi:beta-glucosidase